jgi:hypothetical protein
MDNRGKLPLITAFTPLYAILFPKNRLKISWPTFPATPQCAEKPIQTI